MTEHGHPDENPDAGERTKETIPDEEWTHEKQGEREPRAGKGGEHPTPGAGEHDKPNG